MPDSKALLEFESLIEANGTVEHQDALRVLKAEWINLFESKDQKLGLSPPHISKHNHVLSWAQQMCLIIEMLEEAHLHKILVRTQTETDSASCKEDDRGNHGDSKNIEATMTGVPTRPALMVPYKTRARTGTPNLKPGGGKRLHIKVTNMLSGQDIVVRPRARDSIAQMKKLLAEQTGVSFCDLFVAQAPVKASCNGDAFPCLLLPTPATGHAAGTGVAPGKGMEEEEAAVGELCDDTATVGDSGLADAGTTVLMMARDLIPMRPFTYGHENGSHAGVPPEVSGLPTGGGFHDVSREGLFTGQVEGPKVVASINSLSFAFI